MIDQYVEKDSLCIYTTHPRESLKRIADIVNDTLYAPIIDKDQEPTFGNRTTIFNIRRGSPTEENGVGVWHWTAVPHNRLENKDYAEADYLKQYRPIRIVLVMGANSDESLAEKIKGGINIQPLKCDTLFIYSVPRDNYRGVLCEKESLIFDGSTVSLSPDALVLPVLSITGKQIISLGDRLHFLKTLTLPEESGHIVVGPIYDTIKERFLKRVTRKYCKNLLGTSNSEWQDFMLLVNSVLEPTFFEDIQETFHCSEDQAKIWVEEFVRKVSLNIEAEDFDVAILGTLVENNSVLRGKCEDIVLSNWEREHEEEIAKAKAEAKEIIQKADNEVALRRGQLDQELEDAEKLTSELTKKRDDIGKQIEGLKGQVARYVEEIEDKKREVARYENLALEASEAMKARIAKAQEDVASFIADLSVFMPRVDKPGSFSQAVQKWTHHPGIDYVIEKPDFTEKCDSWEQVAELIEDNMKAAGVITRFRPLISRLLYSAYLQGIPVMLVGPCGEAIAHGFSLAVTGRTAAVLDCSGEVNHSAIEELNQTEDEIVIVRNPLHPDWLMEQTKCENLTGKMTFWVHPYSEDLCVEPKGLYNYVLPVLTEFLADCQPVLSEMFAGMTSDDFECFEDDSPVGVDLIPIRKLGLGVMGTKKLKSAIGKAKLMSQDKDLCDMDYLFGILSIAVVVQRFDILQGILENYKDIVAKRKLSSFVKAEFLRYCADE